MRSSPRQGLGGVAPTSGHPGGPLLIYLHSGAGWGAVCVPVPPPPAGPADGHVCSRQLQTTSSRSYVSSAPAGLNKDEDTGRFHGTKKGNFHEIFNLTENERPLAGMCALVCGRPGLLGARAGPGSGDGDRAPGGLRAGRRSGVCAWPTRPAPGGC